MDRCFLGTFWGSPLADRIYDGQVNDQRHEEGYEYHLTQISDTPTREDKDMVCDVIKNMRKNDKHSGCFGRNRFH